jgi:hypothetical protein
MNASINSPSFQKMSRLTIWRVNDYLTTKRMMKKKTAISLRLSPEQSGKVEYERERLLGTVNKFIQILANPSSLSRSYSTFPLCPGNNLN